MIFVLLTAVDNVVIDSTNTTHTNIGTRIIVCLDGKYNRDTNDY